MTIDDRLPDPQPVTHPTVTARFERRRAPALQQRWFALGCAWTGACEAARMVASMVGSVTWRKVDDAARDIGVLVDVVTGADPVVTVRDLRGPVGSDIAAHK